MSITEGVVAGLQIRQKREELQFEKTKRDQELKIRGYNPDDLSIIPGSEADVQKAQNDQTLQLAKSLQGKLAAQDTDNAILDFSETGDATYLQNALDKNPSVKQAWANRGVQQVGNLDWQNDQSLLAKKGFKPSEYDTPEKQDILKKNIYKFYNGTDWDVGLLNNAVAETGALSRIGQNKGQVITDNFQQFRDFMSGPRSSANTAEGHKYETDITKAAEATGVPANLLAAMMNTESSNNPNAVSPKGATGLMQLMPETAYDLGVRNIKDPAENIMAGAKYMQKMLERYNGDTRLALAAYNAGPGTVDKNNGVPPIAETQNYVNKILGNYAAGESYYNSNTPAIKEGQQMGAQPTVNQPDIKDLTGRQNSQADNRIATIQNFMRGNANAAKGSSNANEDAESKVKQQNAESDALKAKAAAQANLVKLRTEGKTATQKDLDEAENQTTDLLTKFGGEESFFKTDFSKPENFNKAWQNVVKINKLEGTTLTQDDKKNVTEIRALIGLADPATKISGAQTGVLDKSLYDVSKYITDSAKGVDRTAAMASFRNTLRHALYGSTLTDGEIKSFNDAFGENKQKLGPVLGQFKVALNQIQAKLDSTANLGNPYTMKVMVGADQERLTKVREALQQRIDYIEGVASGKPVQQANVTPQPKTAPTQRPSLDSIFGGSK